MSALLGLAQWGRVPCPGRMASDRFPVSQVGMKSPGLPPQFPTQDLSVPGCLDDLSHQKGVGTGPVPAEARAKELSLCWCRCADRLKGSSGVLPCTDTGSR